jgi:CHAT domain-containing protein/tetratricopeptide (TPR) repeat protein
MVTPIGFTRRYALALSLFLPHPALLPALPPPPTSEVPTEQATAEDAEPLVLPGVVIEEIPKGSALEKAGLQVGDVILSWERLPNPPANPEGARGEIRSPFDWMWVEIEQAPRGVVVLRGERRGGALEVLLPAGERLKHRALAMRDHSTMKADDKECWKRVSKAKDSAGTLTNVSENDQLAEVCKKGKLRFYYLQLMAEEGVARNDLKSAEEFYGTLAREGESIWLGPLHMAKIEWGKASIAWSRGQYHSARDSFQAATKIYEECAPSSLALAGLLYKLASAEAVLGKFGRAEEIAVQALSIAVRHPGEKVLVSGILNTISNIYSETGRVAESESILRYALDLVEEEEAPGPVKCHMLNNLARIDTRNDRLAPALSKFYAALECYLELSPDSSVVLALLGNIGNIFLFRGAPDIAIRFYEKGLGSHSGVGPESIERIRLMNNLSSAYWEMGNMERSRSISQQALALGRRVAPNGLVTAAALAALGLDCYNHSSLDCAVKYYSEAIDILEAGDVISDQLANSLTGLGMTLGAQGSKEGAIAALRRAASIIRETAPLSESAAQIHYEYALELFDVDAESAISAIGYSCEAVDKFLTSRPGSLTIRERYQNQHELVFKTALSFLVREKHHDRAFQTLEQFRARKLLAGLAERKQTGPGDEGADLRRIGLAMLAGDESWRASLLESQAMRDVERELIIDGSVSIPESEIIPYDVARAREAIGDGTVLLSYFIGPSGALLFVLSSDGPLEVHCLALSPARLTERISSLIDEVIAVRGRRRAPSDLRWQGTMRDLRRVLIEPAEAALMGARRVLVFADGALNRLPWALLMRSATSKVPLEDHSVVIGSSVGLQELWRGRKESRAAGEFALIVGSSASGAEENDSGRRPGRQGPESVPWAAREALEVAGMLGESSKLLAGGSIGNERWKYLLEGRPQIIHFAGHVVVEDGSPLDSRIMIGSDPESDVTVRDILRNPGISADLVVLSGCESALGEHRGGEGLLGLTRAFQYAGARSVIASLWKVNDQATAELMVRFYKHLLSGKTKDQALRHAQMELIQGPIEVTNLKGEKEMRDFSHPYYWAGFQLYGDWQ